MMMREIGQGDNMSDEQAKTTGADGAEKPQDLKTTITVLELVLRLLRWWKGRKDKSEAKGGDDV